MYNSGGISNGTAFWSTTINSITISGTFTILTSGQPRYTTTGGSTGNGYITLAPGTYSLSLLKTDNYSSGAGISTIMWSASSNTNPNLTTSVTTC